MKKKIMMLIAALTMSAASFAQFEQGKFYTSAGLSGLDLNYSDCSKLKLDVGMKAGYFFMQDWMITANVDFGYRKYEPNILKAGAGLRYYIEQNGLYIGAGANYLHQGDYDDLQPTVQLGYAFFLNRTVTLEPEIYYNQSTKCRDYNNVGFRINFGIYFE